MLQWRDKGKLENKGEKKMKRVMAFLFAVLVFLGSITIPTMEVHAAGVEKVYTFNDVAVATEWGVVSEVSGDGVLDITFDGQYQSQFYNIPNLLPLLQEQFYLYMRIPPLPKENNI